MFAVVQHQQHRPVGEPGGQAVGRVGSRARRQHALFPQAECGEDRARDVGGRRELDEAHLAVRPGRGFGGEPGLARAARSDERDEPDVAQGGGEPVELGAADEPGERHRNAASRSRLEHRDVRVGELRRRIGAEFVGEAFPHLGEHGEGFGGPAATVEGPHELGGEPFTQGVFAGELPQFGDEPLVVTEREPGFHAVFGRGQP